MAEYDPGAERHIDDVLAWEAELDMENLESVDVMQLLTNVERIDYAHALANIFAHCKRLGMEKGKPFDHALPLAEGYLAVHGQRWRERGVRITFNRVESDTTQPDGKLFKSYDYCILSKHRTVGFKYGEAHLQTVHPNKLPPGVPPMIYRDIKGNMDLYTQEYTVPECAHLNGSITAADVAPNRRLALEIVAGLAQFKIGVTEVEPSNSIDQDPFEP